jgi:hypothetical protein
VSASALTNAAVIAAYNDLLRSTFHPRYGKVVMTRAVADLEPEKRQRLFRAVREFSDFTEDNNPHGERDMAFFEVDGRKWYYKIDYYDLKMKFGSPDASDPTKTCRILTIAAAEDY